MDFRDNKEALPLPWGYDHSCHFPLILRTSCYSSAERDPALPVIIPEKSTETRNDFCGQVIKGRDLDCQPDYTGVHHETADRDHQKCGELGNKIPVFIMEREKFI